MTSTNRIKTRRIGRLIGLVVLSLAVAVASVSATRKSPSSFLASQPQQRASAKPKAASILAPAEHPMPFHTGEDLNYRVSWSAFSSAASLRLTAPERRNLFGWQTWHFRGEAHTLNIVRALFTIDDQFDSYTDVSSLECRQFETHLNEMGNSSNQVDRLAPGGQTSHTPTPVVVVAPGTRDPLGALYALRGVDWQRTPEFRAPVYDGHNIYEMRAARDAASESIRVPAGAYSASRLSIRVFQYQKEVAAIHFTLWIASDAERTPVLMEASLPFGAIRAELTSATQ